MQLFYNDFNTAYQHVYNMAVQLNAEGNPNSSTQCYGLANDFFAMKAHWGTGATGIKYYLIWCLDYINDNAFNGEPGDVDMSAIINAMLAATFDELTKFMGISDAYRAAVWDAPFNEEFYAALARGFKAWP